VNFFALLFICRFCYRENSRFDIGPPAKILKELEQNVLVLSDIEVSDDDVPVLCRFLNHPQVYLSFCQLVVTFWIEFHHSLRYCTNIMNVPVAV
jgi:hypothetical protein